MPGANFKNPKGELQSTRTFGGSLAGSLNVGDFFSPFFDVVFYTPITVSPVRNIDRGPLGLGDLAFADNESLGASTLGEARASSGVGGNSIKIVSSDGNAQVFGPESGSTIKNFRANLTITSETLHAVEATLVLQPTYFDAIELIKSEVIRFGSLMEIQWGYNSASGGEPLISDKGLFRISEPSVSFASEISIVIKGWDLVSENGSTVDRRRIYKRTSSEFETDLKVIEVLVKRITGGHYTVDSDKLQDKFVDIDDGQITKAHPLKAKKEGQPLIQASDDFTFFRELLVDNNVVYRVVGPDVIQLLSEEEIDGGPSVYTLMWYGQPSTATEIPMISFTSNSIPTLFAPQDSRGTLTCSHKLDEDEPDIRRVGPENVPTAAGSAAVSDIQDKAYFEPAMPTASGTKGASGGALGSSAVLLQGELPARSTAETDKDRDSAGRIRVVVDELPNQQTVRDRIAVEASQFGNTLASIVIPGHPTVLPLQIVTVEGVGKKFGGRYRILKTVHEIGQGGYITKLELLRGTTSGDSASTSPPTNNKVVRSQEADTGSTISPIREE